MNSSASTILKAVWKSATARPGSGSIAISFGLIQFSAARPIAHPTIRLIKLPIGKRLAAGSPLTLLSISGLIAVPRLAPSTSAKAACGGITPWVANDMIIGRNDAEQHPQARRVLVGRDHGQ